MKAFEIGPTNHVFELGQPVLASLLGCAPDSILIEAIQ
jgi:hypothetical protein